MREQKKVKSQVMKIDNKSLCKCKKYSVRPSVEFPLYPFMARGEGGYMAPVAMESSVNLASSTKLQKSTRAYFPETWLWDGLFTGLV